MKGWGVEIEGFIVTVSFYGDSDHNRRGGGLMGGGGSARDVSVVGDSGLG